MNSTNTIVIDLETSGLDPAYHGILSIGAKEAQSGAEFYIECQLREGAAVEEEALLVNGFRPETLNDPDKPTELDALLQLLNFCTHYIGSSKLLLAGMNPGKFDWMFLDVALRRYGLANPFSHRTLDLHSLAFIHAVQRGIVPPQGGFNTGAIYALIGLPDEPRPHHALTGARMEFEAFQKFFAAGHA